MTEAEITSTMKNVLSGIAPEADLDALDPQENLREELELDSIDFLHFLVGLNKELDVEIPESEYGTLTTKEAIVDYLKDASSGASRSAETSASVE